MSKLFNSVTVSHGRSKLLTALSRILLSLSRLGRPLLSGLCIPATLGTLARAVRVVAVALSRRRGLSNGARAGSGAITPPSAPSDAGGEQYV